MPTAVVVCGGVAANASVRAGVSEVANLAGLEAVFPPPEWCTDNGVMVAWAALERMRLFGISAECELEVRPRWPISAMSST